jgi:general secretion pathway protein E
MAQDAIRRAIEREAAAQRAAREASAQAGAERPVLPDADQGAIQDAGDTAQSPKVIRISQLPPHPRTLPMARPDTGLHAVTAAHSGSGEDMAATQVIEPAGPEAAWMNTGPEQAAPVEMDPFGATQVLESALDANSADAESVTAFEIDMGIMMPGVVEPPESFVAIETTYEKTGMIERIESIEDLDALESIEAALGPLAEAESAGAAEPAIELAAVAETEDPAARIDAREVEQAIAELADDPDSLLEALYERFQGRESNLPAALGQLFGYPAMGSREIMSLEVNTAALNLNDARTHHCVIVGDASAPTVLFCDPFDQELRPWLESVLQADLQWALVSPGDLNAFISRREQSMRAMDAVVKDTGGKIDLDKDIDALSLASISQDSSPVVKLVHSTLYDALRAGASDIHIETGASALEIRYRIDGVLMHVASVAGAEVAEQVVSRIKVMSELDIAERRIPQDGRFKSSYDGRPIDFRVSIMPSSFGEDAVLRVLDKQAVTAQMTELTLGSLGFADNMIRSLRRLSERPYGMLLVTGPTGSGKTTTLYAALSETNSGFGKVVTIEDPVEYELPGVLQIPVNEKKGLTFARGLRSILRHDPDKIMVGEIRDPETAQIAIQSALTGHLVFTTVHANNVFDVLSRFTHMGVDPYSFVSALNGILAQRLLRVVCASCGEKITPTAAMLEATGEPLAVARTFNWRAGRGCSECRGTGYKGRKAVGELLVLSDELREAIVERVPVRKLKELARKEGLKSISSAAMDMVREGVTTIEEVQRVTTMA